MIGNYGIIPVVDQTGIIFTHENDYHMYMKIVIWDDMKLSTKVGHVSISMRIVRLCKVNFSLCALNDSLLTKDY
jgi:hypothetical protein